MKNRIISLAFCILLAIGTFAGFFVPDKYYSDTEKRMLAQKKSIVITDFIKGKLGDEIENYLADQFPGRNTFVTIKTITERLTGKTESGGVYFAKGGYLIEVHSSFNEAQTDTNLAAVKDLQDWLDSKNITCFTMLVPTAGCILADKLPAFATEADQKAVIEKAESMGIKVADVTKALSDHADEYIFYRTDHHWTSLGAYYAYAEWMKLRGMKADDIAAWTKESLCNNFYGTTYAKVNWPFIEADTIDWYYKEQVRKVSYNGGTYISDSIIERKYLEGKDQYAAFLNSNQATTVVSGSGSGKLLILKDSYANTFAQFTADDFEETHLIDMRFFKGSVQDYIEENGITEVLVLYNIPNFTGDTSLR